MIVKPNPGQAVDLFEKMSREGRKGDEAKESLAFVFLCALRATYPNGQNSTSFYPQMTPMTADKKSP